MTTEELWRALKSYWINAYLVPPDIIIHDAGSNSATGAFQKNADIVNIKCKEAPVEAVNHMSRVERYKEPFPRLSLSSKQNVRSYHSRRLCSPQWKVLMIAQARTASYQPSLSSSVCRVFVKAPTHHIPTWRNLRWILQKTQRQMSSDCLKHQVNDAKQKRNGPDVTRIRCALLGYYCMVYRERGQNGSGKWTEPFILLDVKERTATVLKNYCP